MVVGIVVAYVVAPPPPPTVDYFAEADALYAPYRDDSPEGVAALAALMGSMTIASIEALERDPLRQAQREAGLASVEIQGRVFEPLRNYMDLHIDPDSASVYGMEPEAYMEWQRRARSLMVEGYLRSEVRARLLAMADSPRAGLLSERSGKSYAHAYQPEMSKLRWPLRFERVVMEDAAQGGRFDMLLESVDAMLALARIGERSPGMGPTIGRGIYTDLLATLRVIATEDLLDSETGLAIIARLEAFESDRVPISVFAHDQTLVHLDAMQYVYGRVGADESAGHQPVAWWVKHFPTTWALHRAGYAAVKERRPLIETLLEAGPAEFPDAYNEVVLWVQGLDDAAALWATMDIQGLVFLSRGIARNRADSVATRVMLALAAYRHDHGGAWPADLEVLVPRYLGALPDDPDAPFPGMPPLYQFDAETGARLWTRGENIVDDGGIPTEFPPRHAPAWQPRGGDRIYLHESEFR